MRIIVFTVTLAAAAAAAQAQTSVTVGADKCSALKTLQEEMGDTKKEEKARIARAARELMDEHLATVETELRSGMDVKLNELQKKIEETRKVAVLEERGAMNTFSIEAVSYDATQVARELQRGDWKTWAMYGGIAVGAGLAAKWVWDHPFFMLLNLAIGGDWPAPPDATTKLPQSMIVDYVRVYSKL